MTSSQQTCKASIAAIFLLLAHAVLLGHLAACHSPAFNEIGHVPAGLCHWMYGRFELYRVNPPLPRMVATLPLLLCDVKTDWSNYIPGPLSRDEILMGIRFAEVNGARTLLTL